MPKEIRTIKALAREYSVEALDTLVKYMREGDPDLRFRCAQEVLNRAFGKPAQVVSGPDEGPIRHDLGMSEAASRIAGEIAMALTVDVS